MTVSIKNFNEAIFVVKHLVAMKEDAKSIGARHRREKGREGEKYMQKLAQGEASDIAAQALKDHGPMTAKALGDLTGRKATTTLSALTRMKRRGLVDNDKGKPAALWFLVEGKQ